MGGDAGCGAACGSPAHHLANRRAGQAIYLKILPQANVVESALRADFEPQARRYSQGKRCLIKQPRQQRRDDERRQEICQFHLAHFKNHQRDGAGGQAGGGIEGIHQLV